MWITNITTIIYILLGAVCLVFSNLCITCNNVAYSVFLVAGTYFAATWLLALLRFEFIAFTILLVYLGAIVILFLFVVMLVPTSDKLASDEASVAEVLLPALIFTPMIFLIYQRNIEIERLAPRFFPTTLNNVEEIGLFLYGPYFTVLFLGGFILLVAIFCIIRIVVANTKLKHAKN